MRVRFVRESEAAKRDERRLLTWPCTSAPTAGGGPFDPYGPPGELPLGAPEQPPVAVAAVAAGRSPPAAALAPSPVAAATASLAITHPLVPIAAALAPLPRRRPPPTRGAALDAQLEDFSAQWRDPINLSRGMSPVISAVTADNVLGATRRAVAFARDKAEAEGGAAARARAIGMGLFAVADGVTLMAYVEYLLRMKGLQVASVGKNIALLIKVLCPPCPAQRGGVTRAAPLDWLVLA